MGRALVTGATGFIGRWALPRLLEAGIEVHALTSRCDRAVDADGIVWHRADLLTAGTEQVVAELRPTHLLHLAWYAEPGHFWTATENLSWVEASLRLGRAFAEAGGQRMVIAGTCAEYEWQRQTHCVERATPTHPSTLYGAAKHSLHTLMTRYAEQAGIELAWGRIFFVFGPHEHPARLVSSVTRALLAGEPALCSHGNQLRDFLYAPELGSAFAALLQSSVQGPVNLASGEPVQIRDLIGAIAAATGRGELVRLGARPAPPGEPDVLTADVNRLREEVGWSPGLSLTEAVERTVAWWRDNH